MQIKHISCLQPTVLTYNTRKSVCKSIIYCILNKGKLMYFEMIFKRFLISIHKSQRLSRFNIDTVIAENSWKVRSSDSYPWQLCYA